MFFRPTYVKVNLQNLRHNIHTLIRRYSNYDHHFAVVKADCYGHGMIPCAKVAAEAGCGYFCTATLDEAIELREEFPVTPILCLGVIRLDQLDVCAKHDITITLGSLDYVRELDKNLPLKAHIKINTGMNRLGLSTREELNDALALLQDSKLELEGVYTHIFQADDREKTEAQFAKFEEITSDCDLSQFKYVHVGASDATEFYEKRPYANTCRLGISMHGLVDYPEVDFKDTFQVISEVAQINEVSEGTLGYNGTHIIAEPERIAVIPIGYADGIIRKNTGRNVFIKGKAYPIVGNICMDMLFVKVDDSVKVGDQVEVLASIKHIKETASHLETIPYEVICSISKRVPRIYEDFQEPVVDIIKD